jgi:hypothetical protein
MAALTTWHFAGSISTLEAYFFNATPPQGRTPRQGLHPPRRLPNGPLDRMGRVYRLAGAIAFTKNVHPEQFTPGPKPEIGQDPDMSGSVRPHKPYPRPGRTGHTLWVSFPAVRSGVPEFVEEEL